MLYYKWIFIEHCIVLLILASSTITYTLQNKDKFHLYPPSSCVVIHICYKMFYDYIYDVVKKFQMNVYAEWQELEGIGYQLRTHRTALGTSQSSSEAVLGQYFPYSLILYTLHLSECIMINVLLIFYCCSCCEIGILINIPNTSESLNLIHSFQEKILAV